ncbi:MAG: beta-ketoacyl-[acyl-carrier-protein] synthase family protein [Verrucomicrobia bacterium]|nr:beta-ketoacyl-[acyl-carrier-protein] synthase family protein [Verrucomicrobiota bacterium]
MSAATAGPRPVISGLGFITSIGNDRTEVVASLRALRHGLAPFEYLPGCDLPVKVAGTVKGFDTRSDHFSEWRWPERYHFTRERLRSLPPHGLHACCAVEQMIADARLTPELLAAADTGLFTASAGSPFLQRRYLNLMYESQGERLAPLGVISTISGTLNFNLGAHYHIRGAVCGFNSACASAAHAIGYACDEVRLGRLQRVLIVGAEDLTADSVYSFHGLRALSRNPDPDTASRPFDAARDGFVGTGGAVALLVENEASALARGAPIYAEVRGWGQSADGYNVAISDPEGAGLARAMETAIRAAGVTPGEVDYVNAHATSTPAGDRSEALALRTVFGAAGARPAISSTKALTGHGLSMASVMETGFCALALSEGFIPGQAHLVTPAPECEGLHLPRSTESRAPRIVLKNSSGFGGSNVVLVLARHERSSDAARCA